MMQDHEPFAICLEPSEREAIEREDLLIFEPVPLHHAPPADPAAAAATLAELIGCAPAEVGAKPRRGGAFTLTLSMHAAALLDHVLQYPSAR